MVIIHRWVSEFSVALFQDHVHATVRLYNFQNMTLTFYPDGLEGPALGESRQLKVRNSEIGYHIVLGNTETMPRVSMWNHTKDAQPYYDQWLARQVML